MQRRRTSLEICVDAEAAARCKQVAPAHGPRLNPERTGRHPQNAELMVDVKRRFGKDKAEIEGAPVLIDRSAATQPPGNMPACA
jgi:hypothetical protein